MPGRNTGRKKCDRCALGAGCAGVVPPEWSQGAKHTGKVDVLFLGEAPGEDEDAGGRPFTGPAGQLLRQAVEQLGLERYVITNACLCRPPGNRTPHKDELAACAPRLHGLIKKAKPRVIAALGKTGAKAATGKVYKMGDIAGRALPTSPPILVMYHPSFALHKPGALGLVELNFEILGKVLNGAYGPGEVSWSVARTVPEADRIIEEMSDGRLVAFDYETENLDPWAGEILSIGFCAEPGEAYSIPFGLIDKAHLSAWLRTPTPKTVQNYAFEGLWSKMKLGVWPTSVKYDPMVMHFTINENPPHSLWYLSHKYTDIGGYDDRVAVALASGIKHHELDPEDLYMYNAGDCDATLRATDGLRKLMVKVNRWQHDKVLLPTEKMLTRISYHGMALSQKQLASTRYRVLTEMAAITGEMRGMAEVAAWEKDTGKEFNPRSTVQLRPILFERIKLPVTSRSHETNNPSTKTEAIKSYAGVHPIVPKLLEFRDHDSDREFTDTLSGSTKPDGRIHPSYHVTGTPTGQISCTEPNAMGIPAEEGNPIKRSFISVHGKHGLIISADYSQLELRLIASDSGDERMCEAYRAGEDLHRRTAAELLHKPMDEVEPDERTFFKRVNFAIVYGISARRLSLQLEIGHTEAQEVLRNYFHVFEGVAAWREETRRQAKLATYMDSWFGLRRHLPEVLSSNWLEYEDALRRAVSHRIQSTGRQLCLMGALEVERRLQAVADQFEVTDAVALCNTVHDSLIADSHEDCLEEACVQMHLGMVDDLLSRLPKLLVPLVVDIKYGRNWDSDKEWEPNA